MPTLALVNIGAAPDDGTGDPLRTAFGKQNDFVPVLEGDGRTIREATHFAAGTSKVVSDAVWGTPSGNNVTITSAGSNLPVLIVGQMFEVDHPNQAADDGHYLVTASTAASLATTKITGSAPVSATSASVTINYYYPIDPTDPLDRSIEVLGSVANSDQLTANMQVRPDPRGTAVWSTRTGNSARGYFEKGDASIFSAIFYGIGSAGTSQRTLGAAGDFVVWARVTDGAGYKFIAEQNPTPSELAAKVLSSGMFGDLATADGVSVSQIQGSVGETLPISLLQGYPDNVNQVPLGNNTWGQINDAQMATGAGGKWTDATDSGTAISVTNALHGTRRTLTGTTPTITLDANVTTATRVAFLANSQTVTVAVEAGAQYFTSRDAAAGTGATASFTFKGYLEIHWISGTGSNAKWRIYGPTSIGSTNDGPVDFGGYLAHSNLVSVVSSVTGTLTTTAHLGRLIVTNGNITVPTTTGFHCLVKFGGAHTVTFNGTVSAAATSGQVASIIVQSATVIIMTPLATPVTFT